MPNPAYPELALGNIINPGSQSYESVPGFCQQTLIGYIEVDPTDPKTIHPIRVPYTGLEQKVVPDDRLILSGQRVWYGVGIRIPKDVPLTGITALTIKSDLPASSFVIPFPHAPVNAYTPLLGQRVGAMNSVTEPVVPALRPFWKNASVPDVLILQNPFLSNGVLLNPSEGDSTMVLESNAPLLVTGKRDRILRIVVELYTNGLAQPTSIQDLWGYNNSVMES